VNIGVDEASVTCRVAYLVLHTIHDLNGSLVKTGDRGASVVPSGLLYKVEVIVVRHVHTHGSSGGYFHGAPRVAFGDGDGVVVDDTFAGRRYDPPPTVGFHVANIYVRAHPEETVVAPRSVPLVLEKPLEAPVICAPADQHHRVSAVVISATVVVDSRGIVCKEVEEAVIHVEHRDYWPIRHDLRLNI